ncbi:uncharacterized protein [Amphiura filiformis]|uniref:uncharacterized protein n=1 Tax=Amphiura filiformis TaxID=82378 RepID=UPI003B219E9E
MKQQEHAGECEFELIKCLEAGCDKSLRLRALDLAHHHEKPMKRSVSSWYETVSCKNCGEEQVYKKMKMATADETTKTKEETPPQEVFVTIDLVHYVLDGATEELCKSLDPAKAQRRLISTHHLSGDDNREINSIPRLDKKVEKLLEILKTCEVEAYTVFVQALYEFRPELYEHVKAIEGHYLTSGARSKKRPSKPSSAGASSQGSSTSGGAKPGNSSRQSAGGCNYGNRQYSQQANVNFHQFNVRATQINVQGKVINIEGDQTIVGGNVYNFPGNVTIYKDKAYGDKPYQKK